MNALLIIASLFTQAPELPTGYDPAQAIRLDLDDAIALAMRQNLGIVVERQHLEGAKLSEAAATASLYEPTLSASVSHGTANTPPPTAQAGPAGSIIATTTDASSLTLSEHLPTGASVSLGVSGSRVGSTAGTAVDPLTYGSNVTFSVTQPLFRGFSTDLAIPRYSILTARLATEGQRHALELSTAQLVVQVEAAYWDVVGSLYAYDVALASKRAADDAVAIAQRQLAAGMIAPGEVTGAQSIAAQRALAVLSAAQTVETAWDGLRTQLNLPRDQWSRPLLPTDLPGVEAPTIPAPDTAFRTALARRPELAQADLDLKAEDLALQKAKNDALPQLDLALSGSLYGQGATSGGALGQLDGTDAAGWGVGLNFSWTPLDRAAKANLALAKLNREIHLESRDQRVQGIWNEVRAAVRNARAAEQQVTAAADALALATQSLAIETRKYATGQSSNADIATWQQTLVGAQLAELQARLGREKARTALLLATGQLLDARHIRLVSSGRR